MWVAKGRRHAAFGAAVPPSKGAGGGGGGTASCAQDRAFNLGGAVRNGENLQDARLGGKFLSRASFQSAYLVGATLAGATATDASFVNANMERANLEALHGAGADFSAAMLKGANFGNAALSKATFSGVRSPSLGVDSPTAPHTPEPRGERRCKPGRVPLRRSVPLPRQPRQS